MRVVLLLFLSFSGASQNLFEGNVINKNGEKISGANIYLPSSNQVKNSDAKGSFFIKTDTQLITIVISHVGYKTEAFEVDLNNELKKDFVLKEGILLKDEIKVFSTRVREESPFAFSNINNHYIEKNNIAKDIPFLLDFTPSVHTTSDSGNGIGYTGIRIRGSDATRVNVTINGIPYNDSESHGVFWVNMPDLASSTNSIQIQRGVGSSTNGGGAFGGTVSIKTGNPSENFSLNYSSSAGSFSTFKNRFDFNSGLIKNKLNLNLRLSKINSDGYIDRAYSDLKSYYASASYYFDNSTIDIINFSGKEKTYQSWWGVPESRVNNNLEGMQAVIINNGLNQDQANNLLNSGRTYNYYTYDNEIDNYQQDHYQVHWNRELSEFSRLHIATHYTYGRGYYEQFKPDDNLINYFDFLEDKTTDIIRRKWLDNHFYGFTFAYLNKTEGGELNIGGAFNRYDGDHFGKIISSGTSNFLLKDPYYFSASTKKDANIFIKYDFLLNKKTRFFTDFQVRTYSHISGGSDDNRAFVDIDSKKIFLNPKIGFHKKINHRINMYSSFALANREPIRSDFIESKIDPKHETLYDIELGKNFNYKRGILNLNLYWMEYKNQLIATGEINDVGGNIRTNAKKSRRFGIEISNSTNTSTFRINSSITLSKNYVFDFEEILYDYGPNFDKFKPIRNSYTKTHLAFSPSIITNNVIEWKTNKYLNISLKSKYIGKQYLDNTSNSNRIIKSYFINDLEFESRLTRKLFKNILFKFQINNIFDRLYSSNGYTFGYFGGQTYEVRENYLYPQAGRNFMLSINVKI